MKNVMEFDTIEDRDKQIRIWLKQGHKNRDIAERVGLTEQRIGQIKKEMELEEKKIDIAVLIVFEDHSTLDNGYEQFIPSRICAIGFIESENDKFIKLRHVSSITLEKGIQTSLILKSTIIKRMNYQRVF